MRKGIMGNKECHFVKGSAIVLGNTCNRWIHILDLCNIFLGPVFTISLCNSNSRKPAALKLITLSSMYFFQTYDCYANHISLILYMNTQYLLCQRGYAWQLTSSIWLVAQSTVQTISACVSCWTSLIFQPRVMQASLITWLAAESRGTGISCRTRLLVLARMVKTGLKNYFIS